MEIAKLLYLPKKFVHPLEMVFDLYRKRLTLKLGDGNTVGRYAAKSQSAV